MRRTVATLLVVASPLLMAAPVSAQQVRAAGPAVVPASPGVVQGVSPADPGPARTPAPATIAPPAVPAPAAAAAVRQLPPTPVVTRHAVKAVRAEAPAATDLNDAAYAAKLQADLCQARQIFCGLDRSGHYAAG